MSEKEKQHIVAEVNILRDLKHPNIVKYYDRIIDKKNTKIYIVMEYCEGGDIGALIKRCKKNSDYIAEDVIWKIFTQLVLALHECHTRKEGKILHRDLKPSNVFLDKENNVKLGDFGLSRVLSTESTFAYSHVGTPYYMSPEQIDEAKYNEKSDIWSLGCFMYELTTFNPPFEAKNHLSLAIKIKNGKIERINSRYSEELSRVINWLLFVNQDKRPSIEDLLNLPHVSLRLRERRLKDTMTKLKKIEDNLKQKENDLISKENELKEKEKRIQERESFITLKEQEVKEILIKLQKEKEKSFIKNNSNFNEKSINLEDKQFSSDKYNLPLQMPNGRTNYNSTNKELETIADSIETKINQSSLNNNYLNLLNNKDININYNINNKIKFKDNFEMFSERNKSYAENNTSSYEITTRDIKSKEIKQANEYTFNSNTNYIYLNNHNNIDITDPKNNSEHNSSKNSLTKTSEINLKYLNDNISPHESNIDNKNIYFKNNPYQHVKQDNNNNFNFDPSLYREHRDTKYAANNIIHAINTTNDEYVNAPQKINSYNSSKKLSEINSTHPIHSNITNNLIPFPTQNEGRDNSQYNTNINNNNNNNHTNQSSRILPSSPVINHTKSFLSNKNFKQTTQVEDKISTVTSTPQISNRLSYHTMSINTKNSLIKTNASINLLNTNNSANINKYSSILTRDRSFSPSVAVTNKYNKNISKPPLSIYK